MMLYFGKGKTHYAEYFSQEFRIMSGPRELSPVLFDFQDKIDPNRK